MNAERRRAPICPFAGLVLGFLLSGSGIFTCDGLFEGERVEGHWRTSPPGWIW
jgi:hypothetical protein